ncbi:MAG: hypothetical protein IJ080_04690 [Oscillospiraceae bacterium]|nr:hypothetical protein [Oscillospiraceae bacterium]MBQ8979045.1 hypothetical protein [Oscillospiraceae bacterium]
MYTFNSDRRGRYFISLAAFVLTVIILLALNVLRLYVREKFPQYLPDMTIVKSLPEKIIIIFMAVFAALYLVVIIFVLPKWYSSLKYVIDNGKITSYAGIFTRTYTIMRISSIQHAAIVSTPLSKYTSFNFISLNALGGNIIMLFLSDKDCHKILTLIREYRFSDSRIKTYSQKPAYSFDGYDVDIQDRDDEDRWQTSMFDSASQLSLDDIRDQ